MTRSSGFARIGLNSARWLLPLIAVLFDSDTLGYAMSNAIAGSTLASTQAEVRSAGSTSVGVMSMTSPASTGHASPNGCCTWN